MAISIHALLAESDAMLLSMFVPSVTFLSTLSLRRATASSRRKRRNEAISIHALLAESDPDPPVVADPVVYFYPRSPCGERRPQTPPSPASFRFLSTLSLRRATCIASASRSVSFYFYPRSPCGERRQASGAEPTPEAISIHALLAESDKSTPTPPALST